MGRIQLHISPSVWSSSGVAAPKAYMIGDYPLMLCWASPGWRLLPRPGRGSEQARGWMEQHFDCQLRFSTRKEALMTLAAYHSLDPIPLDPLPELRKSSDGVYYTRDGKWKIRRAGGFSKLWIASTVDGSVSPRRIHVRSTLFLARLAIGNG